ncbi:hypothetical protein AB0M36_34705 [Actinoplanes sp. NPDC051346]|uniref:hypothetical protein n=1 Tax=Actinoplanes sp. NPDC051346 TaxID=3155048 RepID=UPI00343CE75A
MTDPTPTPAPTTPCLCGDSSCTDLMPKDQDRSQCCMHCGYYDCDVCGWSDPNPVVSLDFPGGLL